VPLELVAVALVVVDLVIDPDLPFVVAAVELVILRIEAEVDVFCFVPGSGGYDWIPEISDQ
jgi:hypothetical protein